MTSTCLCGAVQVTIETAPEFIHDCNCTLCRKTGGAWSYFGSAAVRVSGATVTTQRPDRPSPAVDIHSCAACHVTTHFALSEAFRAANPEADQVGVNMRLFDPDELRSIEVRYPDGKGWDGVHPFGYRREAFKIGGTSRW